MIRLTEILKEEFEDMKLSDFANKRLAGATKIASDAKEKGGPAILTYEHFAVKLPHYKEAAEGNFDLEKATASYNQYMEALHKLTADKQPDAVQFQKIVGLLEVLGELIIKHKTENVNEAEQPHQKEMIDGIVEMLVQVKDIDNRKQMALDRLRDFRKEGIEVNADEFMERCGLGEMNEKWSAKYKRSIDCSHPKGFSQRAHCQGRKKHEVIEEAMQLFLEKNCPTDPDKWSASKAAAKRKFDVYPSAYANGWAAKNYKSKGGGWRTCKG